MRDVLVLKGVTGFVCAAALASCSLWLNTDERQCRRDSDCVQAHLGTLCVQEVCQEMASSTDSLMSTECPDASTCNAVRSDASQDEGPSSCTHDVDCTAKDAPRCLDATCVSEELANQWLCSADEQSIKTSDIRYGFHVVEFLSGMPPKNIVVKACRNNDPACERPIDTFKDVDQTGHVQFKLPTGFFGFFEIHSDAMDTLLYVTKPIVKNTLNRDLPLLASSTVELTASIAHTKFDTKKGIVLIEALDCSDTPQGGIHFEGKSGQPFYLVNQAPDVDAQLTVYDDTNNSADGGFINVEPGFVTFTARLGTDGLKLGTFNAQVRANTMTFIDMHF